MEYTITDAAGAKMDDLNQTDEWNKMIVDIEVKEEKSIRVNISLSESCYKTIDYYKETVGLSSGRTDFIVTAIKFFYFDTMKRLEKLISEEFEDLPPREQLHQLKSLVRDRVESGLGASKLLYEGKRAQQTTIYISDRLKNGLEDLESFSGKKVGEIILAAIAIYHQNLSSQIKLRNGVIDKYNELLAEVRKNK